MQLLGELGVFLIAFVATLLSSMSGGGSSIIAIPLFLAMGIPLLLATAIQRVSAVFWVIPASRNYLEGRKLDWTFIVWFSLFGIVGVLIGVAFLVSITERVLQLIIGVIIIAVVLWLYKDKNFGLRGEAVTTLKKKCAYVFALPIGFYEAIFGSGNGIIFSLVGVKFRGYDVSESLGYYFAVAFPWVALAAGLLIMKGYYDVSLMSFAAGGSLLGGYLGSKLARYKGNAFVKSMFCAIGFVLGLKLILGW